jgi:flagellar hook protein FlgE
MVTSLTGLNANQLAIEVAGNNISNANTNGYKGDRAVFQNSFLQTFGEGATPTADSGGTNPFQVGRGVQMSGTQRMFTQGSIENTGINTDVAIEGDGMFIARDSQGGQFYTRDGSFRLNSQNVLTTSGGMFVQGYGTDDNFNLITGNLSEIQIPIGLLNSGVASTLARLDGNLDVSGTPATTGSTVTSQSFTDSSGAPATGGTLLSDLSSGGGAPFAAGDTLTLQGRKGGREMPEATFAVAAGSTLDDLGQFVLDSMGVNTDPALNPPAGASVVSGQLVITGNPGSENDIIIDASDLTSSNPNAPSPFTFSQTPADGASVFTSFNVFDSLGQPATVNITAIMDSKTSAGAEWSFFAESNDDTDLSPVLGTGTLQFDTNGQLQAVSGNSLIINRAGTGSADPLTIDLDFSTMTGFDTQQSSLVMSDQDGMPAGQLNNFSIGQDGVILGTFSNGLSVTLGQMVLGSFSNPEGLVAASSNLFREGPNSGSARIGPPMTLGAGNIKAGSLELSNVDLSKEFINLITASTGFSAASRVITTSDELLQELLSVIR